jgi:NlpC/P60 family
MVEPKRAPQGVLFRVGQTAYPGRGSSRFAHTSFKNPLTLIGLLVLLVFGLAHAGKARAATVSAKATRVVQIALKQRGVPYRWGGTSPQTGFDCSGFTRWVYAHVGINLPHSSYAQFTMGRRISLGQLKPGDLLFFYGLGHVGMYIGRGRYIDAPHSGELACTSAGWRTARPQSTVPAASSATNCRCTRTRWNWPTVTVRPLAAGPAFSALRGAAWYLSNCSVTRSYASEPVRPRAGWQHPVRGVVALVSVAGAEELKATICP